MPYRSRSRRPKSPLHHNPEAVRQARLAAKLKQAELARAIGRSPGFLSEVENGERGASAETLERIAKVLAIDVALLERPRSHRCPRCTFTFDLPADSRIPLHQVRSTGTWCRRGGTLLHQVAAA